MDDLAIARALRVLAVVLWIGGVAFVTLVLLPSIRRRQNGAALDLFKALESPFYTTLIAGLTGFNMVHRPDVWDRFDDPAWC